MCDAFQRGYFYTFENVPLRTEVVIPRNNIPADRICPHGITALVSDKVVNGSLQKV